MQAHFENVTTIDIAALFDDTSAVRPAIAVEVARALAEHGAFLATGFPGGDDIDRRMEKLLAFFTLNRAGKMSCATRRDDPASPNVNRGYIAPPEDKGWAYNEFFDIGPDPVPSVPSGLPARELLEEPTRWPTTEPYSGWVTESRALFNDMVGLCRGVLGGMMEGLGLDPSPALALCEGNNATLRLLNYPEVPDHFVAGEGEVVPEQFDELGRRILTQRHLDMNLASLLWQDPVGGLQMQAPDGIWREVPVDQGGISVHNGVMIDRLTGGRVPGTPHRVAGPTGNRRSVGMFHEPDFSALMDSEESRPPEVYARQLLRRYKAYPDMAPFIPDEMAA
ncbi:MAG: isopenicillin N synthase family oxygenase [Rhodospirillales bacterium]|nr:isopenicillin N synthase family oxygenase [Rhodospirillales bacterium]